MKFRIEVTSMNIDKYLDILKKYNLEKETEYEEEKYFITINNLEELIQFHKEINHGIIIDTFLLLSQEVEERLAEYLTARIEEANSYILKKIGEVVKQISTLIPSQAYQIQQILKFGGTYEEIAKELARVSGKNVQDIYKIFEEVAKNNKQFAKQFYEYRGIDYIPYNKDIALQNMVKSIGDITAQTYVNISRTRGIGFLFKNKDGQMYFKDIQQAYYEIIDRGILAISQGKETFQTEMRRIIKDVGNNGVVLYESGRTRRLDSAVRMNILDGIRQVSNETAQRFAQEYDADGVEISTHINPAPDHR